MTPSADVDDVAIVNAAEQSMVCEQVWRRRLAQETNRHQTPSERLKTIIGLMNK